MLPGGFCYLSAWLRPDDYWRCCLYLLLETVVEAPFSLSLSYPSDILLGLHEGFGAYRENDRKVHNPYQNSKKLSIFVEKPGVPENEGIEIIGMHKR